MEGSFSIRGDLLGGADAPYQVNIVNPPEGAVVTSVEGGVEIHWTPPLSFVTGFEQFKSYPLEVEMVAQGEEGALSLRKIVDVGVYVAHTPLASHLMEIDVAPPAPVFKEGHKGSFTIQGHIREGAVATHNIEVLNAPPEAQVLPTKGGIEVVWTPPLNTVLGMDQFISYPLEVKMIARNNEGVFSITKVVDLGIYVASPPVAPHLLDILVESPGDQGVGLPGEPSFMEGEEGRVKILGDLLGGVQTDYAVHVLNLPEGATFASIEGGIEMVWTPPYSFVKGIYRSSLFLLQVEMVAKGEEGDVVHREQVPLRVYVASTPLSQEGLVLVAEPASPVFTEGEEGRLILSSQVAEGVSASVRVNILNLPEGATQREVEKGVEVTWTPPFHPYQQRQ